MSRKIEVIKQEMSFFLLISFMLGVLATPVSTKETGGITATHITAGLGIEYLEYEEWLPELSLKSNAKVTNIVVRVEGVWRWENIFVGFQGLAPVASFDSTEEWFANTTLGQTNLLSYEKFQAATFMGYSFNQIFNPYLGLRSVWSYQDRSDFRNYDRVLISSARITETVKAHYISLGFRGGWPIAKIWELTYGAEYNLPYYEKVTNDGLPGWEARNTNGYLWSIFGEMSYVFEEKFALSLLICGGQNHWDGSEWQDYNNVQIKWPENDTYFIHSFVNFNWIY